MTRMPPPRSVYTTVRITSLTIPVMTYLISPGALSKSHRSKANTSSNTQRAASKLTPCFTRLLSALAASHSKSSSSIMYGLPVVFVKSGKIGPTPYHGIVLDLKRTRGKHLLMVLLFYWDDFPEYVAIDLKDGLQVSSRSEERRVGKDGRS